jgi:hypothetical protein
VRLALRFCGFKEQITDDRPLGKVALFMINGSSFAKMKAGLSPKTNRSDQQLSHQPSLGESGSCMGDFISESKKQPQLAFRLNSPSSVSLNAFSRNWSQI